MSIWLEKVGNNILENARINRIRKLPGGDTYVIVFMKMLLRADADGLVCDCTNYRFFANDIGEEYEMFILAIAILREMCLITLNENEDVYISNTVIHAEGVQTLFK